MGIFHNKPSYFKLVEKALIKSRNWSYLSQFNKDYSLQSKKFVPIKKDIKYITKDLSELLHWKTYLLTKLETSDQSNWKYNLSVILEDKDYYNSYFFQNEIFFYEFFLINFPNINKDEYKNQTILYTMDSDDLRTYSVSSKEKHKSKNKNKNNVLIDIEDDDECELSADLNITIKNKTITEEMLKKDQNNRIKYNTNLIKLYINFMLKQLQRTDEDNIHPISDVIKIFSKNYKIKLNNYLEKNTEDWKKLKEKVVNEIQEFIEIMQVALKLFYLKSINYQFFINEEDEFNNLICYVLFNQEHKINIYEEVFKIFQKSNEEKQNNLKETIDEFGNLTPKEAGINPKFCLDEVTEEFIKNYEKSLIKKNTNKAEIMKELKEKYILNHNINKSQNNDEGLKKTFTDKEIGENIKNNQKQDIKTININKQIFSKNFINEDKQSEDKETNDNSNSISNPFKSEAKANNLLVDSNYKKLVQEYNNIEENDDTNEMFMNEILNKSMSIKFISFKHMKENITSNNTSSIPYKDAIEYMKNIKKYKGPLEKLTIISLTSVIIKDCVDKFWKKNYDKELPFKFLNIEADDLLSIYLYIIYNMNMDENFDNIISEFDFIKNFVTQTTIRSIVGYYFTTANICINLIIDADEKEDLGKKKKVSK
jgi:hypothetical protein